MKVCMLSHGDIANDGRVLKTIDYLMSKKYEVWVFYIVSAKEELVRNNENLFVRRIQKKEGIFQKVLRHSLYYFEFNYLVNAAINENVIFDFVYVHDFPALYAGWRIKQKMKNAKLIYDSHEIFNETLNQYFPDSAGIIKDTVFKIMLFYMRSSGYFIEKYLARKSDLFITVNESLKDYFEKEYKISGIKVVMNCPKLQNDSSEISFTVDYRKQFGWMEKSVIFIYQGVLNKGRGLELLLDAFVDTPSHFYLVFVGDGVLLQFLKRKCEDYKLSHRVKFVGFVDYNKLVFYTKAADVGINLLEAYNLSKALASPNKLFEYVHANIPVLASNTLENWRVVDKYKIGVLVDNTHADILNGLFLFDNSDFLESMSMCFSEAKLEYNWESQIQRISSLI